MRIILVILGILMLLPGACGAVFTVMAATETELAGVLMISLPSLAIGIAGIFLIRYAVRRPQ